MTRVEDTELLRGRRPFVADFVVPEMLHAVFVRSTSAHAAIVDVDVADALDQPGIVAVDTAATLTLPTIHHVPGIGSDMSRRPLAAEAIRHVGEAIAVVTAESHELAIDAAELVVVDLDDRAPVLDPTDERSPALYVGTGGNVAFEITDLDDDPVGNEPLVDVTITNNRVASAPIECDGIITVPDGSGGIDVTCTSQGVHSIRDELARALDLDADSIRVRSPAVGGGFGGRVSMPVEFAVVCSLALRHDRPVRWLQSRSENLMCMPQGRDTITRVRLAVDDTHRIAALDVHHTSDSGATVHGGATLMVSAERQIVGMYDIGQLRWNSVSRLTNTTPVGAYRGAGQPEANHARERAIDIAASRLGIDPIELRRLNLLDSTGFPHTAPGGVTYDVGDPQMSLDMALDVIGLQTVRDEQRRRRESGDDRLLGIGVACYAQTSGRGTPADTAEVTIADDGRVLIHSGSASHGQGHTTTIASIVSQRLGIAVEDIDLVDADTAVIDSGLTTGGSRASQVLASVVDEACDDIIREASELAARLLEASVDDIVVAPAHDLTPAGLAVAGVPARRIPWSDLATRSPNRCLAATRHESTLGEAHPFGTHVSVVEVDRPTGDVTVLRHVAVDDCGVVLQPQLVAGQQHGGSVAGISQAIWEHITFDPDGQPQTTNLTTYGLPSAAELPFLECSTTAVRTERNRLGTKGIGENGCNGATAAVHNAVCDALAHLGVEHIDLPLTPERVWTAIAGAST